MWVWCLINGLSNKLSNKEHWVMKWNPPKRNEQRGAKVRTHLNQWSLKLMSWYQASLLSCFNYHFKELNLKCIVSLTPNKAKEQWKRGKGISSLSCKLTLANDVIRNFSPTEWLDLIWVCFHGSTNVSGLLTEYEVSSPKKILLTFAFNEA